MICDSITCFLSKSVRNSIESKKGSFEDSRYVKRLNMTTNDSQNYLLRLDSPPLEAIFRYLSNPVPLMRTCQTLRRAGQQHMSDEVINSHALGVLWSDMFSLEHVPVRARNNRSFLQIALRRDGPGFFYIADRFKHDIELIKIALASTKLLFPHRLSELVEYLLGSESGF